MELATVGERYRVNSIDILRGLVMVIMALDHVRDFFHNQAFISNPTDPASTTPILFFTRWITHYCAPVFVFLAGTSAYLSGLKKSKKQLSGFLLKRGLWLILVEVLIITLGLSFNPFYNMLFLQVIWAIGISMVLLGLMIWLPFKVILVIGLVIVFGHNLLDAAEAARNQQVGFWWDLLHHGSFAVYPITQNHVVAIFYPFAPWTGIMALGYCLGRLYQNDIEPAVRSKWLIYMGISTFVVFIFIRLMNVYGDPSPWTTQNNSIRTIFSFLNVTKYPPSLSFTCMTLGPALFFLAFLERIRNAITGFFATFGRVPFFYYVVHFYLIHTICVIGFFFAGYTIDQAVTPQFPFVFRPPTFGYDLWVVYILWVVVILLMYPMVRWYNKYKRSHQQWWLSYL